MDQPSDIERIDHVGTFRRTCLFVLMVLIIALDLFTIVQGIVLGTWAVVAFGLGALFIFTPSIVWAALHGRTQLGAHLMLIALWLIIVRETMSGGGIFSEGTLYTFFLIMLSGLLTGSKGVVCWTGLSLLALGLFAYGHHAGFTATTGADLARLWPYTIEMGVVHVIGGLSMFSVQWLQRRTLNALEAEIKVRKHAEACALEAADVKERFLAMMSHELRTPLNGILGATSLLPSARADERDELTGMISSSAGLLLALVNDILDYSRMNAEAMELEAVPIQLEPFLHEVTAPLSLLARQKGLGFSVKVAPELPPWLLGDPTRLRQIVLNFASNAIKFTERGEITITATGAGAGWRLSVRDTGIGIPPQAHVLFAPFAQVDAATTRHYGGTGLG
ncbi:MAG: histidine kinase dimerization/phospho-acceptor domain-containing protein, partial [Myxococcota bacterium]